MIPYRRLFPQSPSFSAIQPALLPGLVFSLNGGLVPEVRRTISFTPTRVRVGATYSTTNSPSSVLCSAALTAALSNLAVSEPLVEIPAGSWTCLMRIYAPTTSGANPGFFRTQSDELGTTFFINNGGNRRPWVRVNGTNVLQAASGAQWPSTGTLDILCRFVNATSVDVWWAGVKQHSATHSTSQNAITGSNGIYVIGRQNVTEYQEGCYSGVRFWSRALSDYWCQLLTTDPQQFYLPNPAKAYRGFTTSSGTLKTWQGLGTANIKTFQGLAKASTKTVNGLTP